ncbi:MAG: hypothetical protein IPO43_21880 [Rhodoferax sp.]|nr:hypothetical protein [Rhodoferax sp.]
MIPERRRLTLGLLLSLMFHALLLSLTFGGQGRGLPGLGLPWQDQRIEALELRVMLLPTPAPAVEPVPTAEIARPVSAEPAMMTVVYPAPPSPLAELTTAPPVPQASPKKLARSEIDAPTPTPTPTPTPAPVPVPVTVPAEQPTESVSPPTAKEDVIALAQSDEATWSVPATPLVPTPVTAAAPSIPSPQTAMTPPRDTGKAEQERALELAKLDQAKQDAQRKAEQMEAERQEAARKEAARAEATRQEAARQDAAGQEATRAEAERQEAARQVAARAEAARVEAARQEVAKQRLHGKMRRDRRPLARQQRWLRLPGAKQNAVRRHARERRARRRHVRKPQPPRPLAVKPPGRRRR